LTFAINAATAAMSLLVIGNRDEEEADTSPTSANGAAGFGMTPLSGCAANL
jgi:hypothetical protein